MRKIANGDIKNRNDTTLRIINRGIINTFIDYNNII